MFVDINGNICDDRESKVKKGDGLVIRLYVFSLFLGNWDICDKSIKD